MAGAGGLLIAPSFVFGIEAFEESGTLPPALMQTGGATFLLIPGAIGNVARCLLAIAAGSAFGETLSAGVKRSPAEMRSS